MKMRGEKQPLSSLSDYIPEKRRHKTAETEKQNLLVRNMRHLSDFNYDNEKFESIVDWFRGQTATLQEGDD